jgi:hypothetical protein
LLVWLADATPASAQGSTILRSQVGVTTGAIQNQIREAVRPRLAVKNPAGAVQSLSLSLDGRLLAIVLEDDTIRLYDLRTGGQRVRLAGTPAHIRAVALSADDRFVVSANDDGSATVWDAVTGAKLRELRGHDGVVNAVALGAVAATGGVDTTVRLWDLATGQALGVLRGHRGPVLSLAVSRDGSRILSGGGDGRAILWSRADARALATFEGHDRGVVAVGFDNAGRAVTTDQSGVVRVWQQNGSNPLRSFRGAANAIGAEVTSDGRYVAVGSAEGRTDLHEIDSGRLVKQFEGPSGSARYISIDVQRQRLLIGGADGMVRVWNLSSGANLGQIISTLNGWAVLDNQGRFDGSQQGVTDVEWVASQSELPIDNFSQTHFEPGLLAKSFSDRPSFVSGAPVQVSGGIFLPPQSTIVISPGPYQAAQTAEVTITTEDRRGGIADVRLFQNFKLVPRTSVTSERDATTNNVRTHITVYRVPLVAGANRFEAFAASDQRVDGVPATAEISATGAPPLPNLYLVTIGINKYKDNRLDLDYGTPDALAIRQALSQSTKSVFDNVVDYRLLDTAASRENILKMLQDLHASRPDDEVVIYYAGHGEIIGKEWYMLPYDVSVTGQQDLVRSGISASELRDALVRVGAERILLFIDACKSGGSVETLAGGMERKVLRDVGRDAGIAILAGTRPDQLAAELPSLGHGAFTYVVLEGLGGRADRDPADGRITASKILRYSLESLPAITTQLGITQVPVAYRRGADFIVKTGVGG